MEEDKQVVENPASNTEEFKPESDLSKITEDDLEQVSGGAASSVKTTVRGIANDVQANRVKTADKNFKAMSDYIKS